MPALLAGLLTMVALLGLSTAARTEAVRDRAVSTEPDQWRCEQLRVQRSAIADELAGIDRHLPAITVEAVADSVRRRRNRLVREDGQLKAEQVPCAAILRRSKGVRLVPPAARSDAGPVAPVRRVKQSDLCSLLPVGFTIGDGNEPGNPSKKPRAGVPRYCEGDSHVTGSYDIALSIAAFADAKAAKAEVERYRTLPGGRPTRISTAAGDFGLEDTERTPGGDDYLLVFVRGRHVVRVRGSGPRSLTAKQIAVGIDATVRTWQ